MAGISKAERARRAETISSNGVGESRIFVAPEGTFPNPNDELRECHINGKRVGDIFTDEQIVNLTWHHTDEGIAARNAGKSDLRVEVGAGPLEKSIQRKKDDVLDRGMETWEASDPMKEVLDANPHPGFRRRFLSDGTVKNKGTRGWQPVIKDGEPVKLGGMTLAEMPEGKAVARNAHFREQGNRRLDQVQQQYVQSGGSTAVSDQ